MCNCTTATASHSSRERGSADLIPVCFRTVSGEINLLKYFQQQRLEHTRLLRKEITRLESLEKVYLSAIRKVG